MISYDTILVRDSEPVAATINDEIFMLSIRAGAYFGLNAVGSKIWRMLVEPQRVGAVYEALSQAFDVDVDTITHDAGLFLESLLEHGLVRVVDAE
jgi:hypothetical protein